MTLRFALAASVTISALSQTVSAREATLQERTELQAVADDADAAWDAKDVGRMLRNYADDASLTVYPSRPLEGRAAMGSFFARGFAQRSGTMRHVTSVSRIDMLSPDMALTDGQVRVEAQRPDGSWQLVRYFVNHSVVERRNGAWRLVHTRVHLKPNREASQAAE